MLLPNSLNTKRRRRKKKFLCNIEMRPADFKFGAGANWLIRRINEGVFALNLHFGWSLVIQKQPEFADGVGVAL
jgi:hypothetical protein